MSSMPGMEMPAANPQSGPQGHDMSSMPGMQMPTANAPAGQPAHDMSSMPGMQMPATTPPQGHQGHDMSSMPGMQMPGHDMADMAEAADPPAAPPPPGALGGPAHAADTVFPAGQMNDARSVFRDEHGAIRTYRVLVDQLETRIQNGRDGYAWDGEAWYGGAINRLWLKTEGEGTFGGGPEQAEVQALWSRALDPWFNLQAGVRYDIRPTPDRGYLVLGIEGLAPYWFEVDGAVFLSQKGDLSARFEGEYEQRITQRLILQPRIDLDFSLQDVPELGIGSGLSSAEAGLRLRYEIVPEFAPYVGVHYGRAFGDTAAFRRAAGRDVGGLSFLVGVRTWF
jgi:copper resistance protein B